MLKFIVTLQIQIRGAFYWLENYFFGGRVEISLYNLSSIDSSPPVCTPSNPTCATTAGLPNETGPFINGQEANDLRADSWITKRNAACLRWLIKRASRCLRPEWPIKSRPQPCAWKPLNLCAGCVNYGWLRCGECVALSPHKIHS